MKKFLLFLSVLFTGIVSAQTNYRVGDEVTDEVWDGESFLLSPDKSRARFLTNDGSKYLTDQIPTEDALVEFECAGEDDAGNILYYIKFSNTGLYLADLEIYDGFDSSDMVIWVLPYMTLTEDTEKAAKWTILPAETRYRAEKGAEDYVANWRTWTGQGTGQDTNESKGNLKVHDGAFVIMRDKLSTSNPNNPTEGGLNPVYLEVQGDYSFFAPWGENSWFISFPEEMDADMLLEAWVASNLGDFDVEAVNANGVGTLAGMYTPVSFAPLYEAWNAYLTWDGGYGEGDASEILAALQTAWEGLERVQVEEGYYYVVAVRGSHAAWDNGGNIVTTGGYEVPRNETTGEYDVTFESAKYVWYFNSVAGKASTFKIQNYGTGMWATSTSEGATIRQALQTKAEGEEFIFELLPNLYGTIYIYHKNDAGYEDCAWNSYHTYSGSPVGNWRDRNDRGNHWQLLRVDTEKALALQEGLAQYNLNQKLATLYNEVLSAYNGLRVAKPSVEGTGDFADHGFVVGDETSINLTSNAPEPTEGNILALADGDRNTFFHSAWSYLAPKPHNLVLDFGETKDLEGITVKILKRNTSEYIANRAVTEWMVYGTNDNPYAEGVTPNWTSQGKLTLKYEYDYEVEGDTVKNGIGLGASILTDAFRYIRFDAVNNLNGEVNQFFTFSEFGVWGATEDLEAVTLLSEVPAAVKETLLAELEKSKVEIVAQLATQTQFNALTAAYNEFLQNLPGFEPILVTRLEIVGGTDVLTVGDSTILDVIVNPSNATNPTIYWESSNPLVATVNDNGVVTAKQAGEVLISASSTDGSNITVSKEMTIYPVDDSGDGSATTPESYANVLYNEEIRICAGIEFVLPVVMRNTEDIISCQFDLFLPDGINIKLDNNGNEIAELNAERAQRSHVMSAKRLSNGAVRFVCYSTRNDAFIGNEGSIVDIPLISDNSLPDGDYEISYRNIVMTKSDAESGYEIDHVISKVTVQTIFGDVNKDGEVNVVDVSDLVSGLLGVSNKDIDMEAADLNNDGKVNVIDVSRLVKIIIGVNFSNKKNEPVVTTLTQTYDPEITQLYVDPFSIQPGEVKDIYVNLNNPESRVTSFEFKLLLPKGIEVVNDGFDDSSYAFKLGSRADKSHVIEGAKQSDGTYKVIAFSHKNQNLTDTAKDVAVITIKAAEYLEEGSYSLEVGKQVICDESLKNVAKGKTYCTIIVGGTTNIGAVGNENSPQTMYDLYGRPTDGKKSGIYIVNGKKLLK